MNARQRQQYNNEFFVILGTFLNGIIANLCHIVLLESH